MNWNAPHDFRKYTNKNMLLPLNTDRWSMLLRKNPKRMVVKLQTIIDSPLIISVYILEIPGKGNIKYNLIWKQCSETVNTKTEEKEYARKKRRQPWLGWVCKTITIALLICPLCLLYLQWQRNMAAALFEVSKASDHAWASEGHYTSQDPTVSFNKHESLDSTRIPF